MDKKEITKILNAEAKGILVHFNGQPTYMLHIDDVIFIKEPTTEIVLENGKCMIEFIIPEETKFNDLKRRRKETRSTQEIATLINKKNKISNKPKMPPDRDTSYKKKPAVINWDSIKKIECKIEPKHLRYSMIAAEQGFNEKRNPVEVMKALGIKYQHATPQSMGDQWWFWNCENLPKQIPVLLTELDADPMECIGYGLSKKEAELIRDYKN